eukprot:NODE_1365_length_1990_cov_129.426352_g1155_i0.p1 GENE.NODE_1365_length_1990_cov_129.426352_g1155_i0~~NODE_1365_length_1990_cov_129.426352_g1155_i0.p1  ORF type:complete len:600 (-),score=135.71 NODE_1365_length_1990_cov_129.426352_g1155_i0:137-1936(-)
MWGSGPTISYPTSFGATPYAPVDTSYAPTTPLYPQASLPTSFSDPFASQGFYGSQAYPSSFPSTPTVAPSLIYNEPFYGQDSSIIPQPTLLPHTDPFYGQESTLLPHTDYYGQGPSALLPRSSSFNQLPLSTGSPWELSRGFPHTNGYGYEDDGYDDYEDYDDYYGGAGHYDDYYGGYNRPPSNGRNNSNANQGNRRYIPPGERDRYFDRLRNQSDHPLSARRYSNPHIPPTGPDGYPRTIADLMYETGAQNSYRVDPDPIPPSRPRPQSVRRIDSNPVDEQSMARTTASAASAWSTYSARPITRKSKASMSHVGGAWGSRRAPVAIPEYIPPDTASSVVASVARTDDGRSVRFVAPKTREGELMDEKTRIDPPMPGSRPPPPPNRALPVSLMEALIMLRVGDTERMPRNKVMLDFILLGGCIMELFLRRKLEIHPNSVRYPTQMQLRMVDSTPVGDEYLDLTLKKFGKKPTKSVRALLDDTQDALVDSPTQKYIERMVGCDWLGHIPAEYPRPPKYPINNDDLYDTLRERIIELMGTRDSDGEPSILDSMLGVLYWAPKDYTDYSFGGSLEAYDAKQLCKAIMYVIRMYRDKFKVDRN